MQNISVVINYCSNESNFIDACLRECAKFSNEIIVSYGSHLYDGILEDYEHINSKKIQYPFVNFVKYNVDKSINLNIQKGVKNRPHAYWHNLARSVGSEYVNKNSFVLFLDVDEIPDGERFKLWWKTHLFDEFVTYKLANYWYFKKPINQALTWEDTVVLVHKRHLIDNHIFGDRERDAIVYESKLRNIRYVLGNDFLPLIHHYSWVRNPKQMLFKLKNWGHQTDFKNHELMVQEIFKNDEVNDIVHNYQYIKVANQFNLEI